MIKDSESVEMTAKVDNAKEEEKDLLTDILELCIQNIEQYGYLGIIGTLEEAKLQLREMVNENVPTQPTE